MLSDITMPAAVSYLLNVEGSDNCVQKGVSSEIVEQVFEEADYGEEDSRQAIEALMRKRNYNPETADAKEKQKMMGYLMRKGFSYQDVRNVLQVCE